MSVDNFYEWEEGSGKQPYAVALADHRLMALAGLWENGRSPTGEWVRSFAIVTLDLAHIRGEADAATHVPKIVSPTRTPKPLDLVTP